MEKTMTVDEFMQEKARASILATLDPVENPGKVRVTPYQPGHDCGCAQGFEVPRNAIKDIKPTGQTLRCCGTLHKVVGLEFKAGPHPASFLQRARRSVLHCLRGF